MTVWTCSQTSRGHTCPPSLAHRSVTRSPSRPELEAISQTALRTGGLTNFARTTVHLQLTSGDEPSHVNTRG